MKFILGTKQNMVQHFDENGMVSPATIVSAGPITVTQVKTADTDGYTAVQVGFGTQKKERLSKPVIGHLGDLGFFKELKEFRIDETSDLKKGDTIDVSTFSKGDMVEVTGISKGKGFQGVVKRHGFKGGPRSHGQKHSEREPGSIGGGLRNRVPKGMRMAGRMGSDTVTIKHLKVLEVNREANQILISGAIPGRRGTLIEIVG
ncbi:MAG: 50S ribosomal protein L3 [Candidatus Paceibacterota bacterium]|jgi:large subunit ribosomal protein L3